MCIGYSAETSLILCRWLSYGPLQQHTLQHPPLHNADGAAEGDGYRLPPGYTSPDPGAAAVRTVLSDGPVHIPPESWVTDNQLKLGASEILSRGQQAEDVNAKLARGDCTQAWANDEHTRLGVRGLPLFWPLSYYRYWVPLPPDPPYLPPELSFASLRSHRT